MTPELPTGTVTFVFTDIEGSTRLLDEVGDAAYGELLSEHHRVCRQAWAAHGGVEVDTAGDAFFVAFTRPSDALAAAIAAQEGLASTQFRVRMGIHTGEVTVNETGYVGLEVHRAARIAAAAHGGQVVVSGPAAALAGTDGLVDLGEHWLKDVHEPVVIFQLGEGRFPPLKTISNTNLPRPASSFVGRERELAEVLARFEEGARLITLTGPGGSGKTRLALEAAATLVSEYKAGVFWVGLAALRDPAFVTETIAQTLGAKDDLAQHIGERQLLLLLDNLEQVIDAAPDLSALLRACPSLTLLVTSRELLRAEGEVEYTVPPLVQPEAVSLFCERAQADPTEEITELCMRLDNLPLAVELAAARTKVLSPAQILERLSQRLDLLKGGRDADPRQQTLRATIEWSYDLLSERERRLFRALSVFAGGCTLDAAEAVAEADLDTLQSLLEKSLLRFSNERYWMLETIRELAAERLAAAGEEPDLAESHAGYMASVFENPYTETTYDNSDLTRIQAELPNLRAALEHALTRRHADLAHRLYVGAFSIWLVRGPASEGDEWGRRVIATPAKDPHARASALAVVGEFARARGDFERSADLKRRAIAELRPLGDVALLAATYSDMAYVLDALGEDVEARRHAEEGVEIRRRIGDPFGVAHAVHVLGEVGRMQGRLEDAMRAYEEARRIWESAGVDPIWTLDSIGDTARRLGDFPTAEAALAAALTGAENVGDRWTTTFAIGHLGQLELDRGSIERGAVLIMVADLLITQHEVYVDPQFVDEICVALADVRSQLAPGRLRTAQASAERIVAADRPSVLLGIHRRSEPASIRQAGTP